MRAVQIVGAASSIVTWPVRPGAERWIFNASYKLDQIQEPRPYHRVFQLHELAGFQRCMPDVFAWCQRQTCPVYLLQADVSIPSSVTFPLADLMRTFAYDGQEEQCFGCTVDYLIAFALMEGFDLIELAGIEVRSSEEYAEQRASISYWIGRARGMRRTVTCHPKSGLCTVPALYGYNTVTGSPAPPGWDLPVTAHKYSVWPEPVPA